MEMRDIQVFQAVMQAGTTSKAGKLLGVSQPAVSQCIRKLEESAGLRLFERVRGRLVPTREAHALMVEVERCFTGFEQIQHRVRSLKSFGLGHLAVAAYSALGVGFMPRAIAAFGLSAQHVQLSFQILRCGDIHQQVSSGQLDFGLIADELHTSGLNSAPFMKLPGVIVMSAAHALARKTVIGTDDLLNHPFMALDADDASRRRLERYMTAEGKPFRPLVETTHSHSICELALQDVGIGMAHPLLALDFVARGLLVKPFAVDIPFTGLLITKPGNALTPAAQALLQCMRLQIERDVERLHAALQMGGVGRDRASFHLGASVPAPASGCVPTIWSE